MFSGAYFTCSYNKKNIRVIKVRKFDTSEEQLTYLDFILSALENTSVELGDFSHFSNAHEAVLEENIFLDYVNYYITHPNFLLNVCTKQFQELAIQPSSNLEQIRWTNESLAETGIGRSLTPEAIKSYIHRKSGGPELFKSFESRKSLTDSQRRKLISFLATFIEEHCSYTPSTEDLQVVAKIAVGFFPCLDLEILVNNKCNGFLQTKLKNDRSKKRKFEKSFEGELVNTSKSTITINDSTDVERDLYVISTAALPEELELVKSKLKSSLNYRRSSLKGKPINYLFENYSCFFVCPDLVLYDFSLSFNESQNLLEHWPKYKSVIFTGVKNSGKNILYTDNIL